MTVGQVIEALKKMPPDADVLHLWDGEARTSIEVIWLAKAGYVVTSDLEHVCYSTEARPEGAPDNKEAPDWYSSDPGFDRPFFKP